MQFLIDTQLPPLLKMYLLSQGFNTTHTIDYAKQQFITDSEIVEIAKLESRVIITKDIDFYDHYLLKSFPPQIILLQIGNCKNNVLLSYFRKNLTTIIEQLSSSGVGLVMCTPQQIVSI
jgi:predicted nuclease of predicted toxin-antitoxin system